MLYQLLLIGTWNISFLTFLTCIAALYIFLLKQSLKMFCRKILLFMLGLGLLGVTAGSPLTSIVHLSSSLHMTQMSILYFIIPPIILLGIPDQLLKKGGKIPGAKKMGKLLPQPKIGLTMFAILFFIYHLPIILDIFSKHEVIQIGYQGLLFILAFSMWWPIAAPNSGKGLTNKQRKSYAFMSGLLLMPACLLFILYALIDGVFSSPLAQSSTNLCLPAQSGVTPLLPSFFNTQLDQFAAGFFMMGLHKLSLMFTCNLSNTKMIDYKYLD